MHEVRIDPSLSKAGRYEEMTRSLTSLLDGESDALANLSNAAALLAQALDRINWCGFYLLRGEELVLGPFQGKPACVRIRLGQGVCGTAVAENRTINVPDVSKVPNYLACSTATKSELVVLIRSGGRIIAQIDIDSHELDAFDAHTVASVERVADWLGRAHAERDPSGVARSTSD